MAHELPSSHPLTTRLEQGAPVTAAEVQAVRLTADSLANTDKETMYQAINRYVAEKRDILSKNIDTESALLALRQTLNKVSTQNLETTGSQMGSAIGQGLDSAYANAKALTLKEWEILRDPQQSTQTRVLHALGILAVGYGVYRAARWALGKSGNGFFGRMFKVLGITALAGFALQKLAPQKSEAVEPATEPKQTPPVETPAKPEKPAPASTSKSPVAAPRAVRKTAPKAVAPEAPKKDLLSAMPEDKNVVGGAPLPFEGGKHFVAFRNDKLIIDGKDYTMKKYGFEVEFEDVRKKKGELHITGGADVPLAGRQSGSTVWTEEELETLVDSLLRTGKYIHEKESVEITRF